MRRKLIAIAVLMLGMMPAIAAAQTQPTPGPFEAGLDRLAATHDTEGLNRAIANVQDVDTAVRALNWLKTRQIVKGGGTQVALLYSATLWRFARNLPEPSQSELRKSAVAQLFLTRWLLLTEGFQCADKTAAGSRYEVIERYLVEISRHMQTLSDADKKAAMNLALEALLVTFKFRENDVWLCQGGIAQYSKYFEKHPEEKGKETQVPGMIGKTIVLPSDPSILPDFLPYADWKVMRRAAINKITDEIGAARLTDFADSSLRVK